MKEVNSTFILKKLKSNNQLEIDQGLELLYEQCQQNVAAFILRNRGNHEDVEDFFHDGIIAFYKLIRQGKIEEKTNVKAYLYTICKNMWSKHLMRRKIKVELDDTYKEIPVAETSVERLIAGDKKDLLDKILSELGDTCEKLLKLYYFERLRMKEIVEILEFSNEQVLRNKKAKCMKAIRQTVLGSQLYTHLLKD